MNKSASTSVTRTSSRLFQSLPALLVVLFLLVSASVWGGLPLPSSVTFDGFDNPDSIYRIDQQCKTPRPDLDDTLQIANWEEWCYIITSLQDTSCCSGEFTHFGVVVDATQHMNDSNVKNFIESTMTVSPNDGDYDKDFKTSGGPLGGELGASHVLWNNQDDHILNENESALFCFATPAIASSSATIGLKVGGDRRSARLEASGDESIATFEVNKNFSDDNPMDVEVQISCDNGLPLKQSQVIREGKGVTFVVKTFDTNQPMNCQIWETQAPGGYAVAYDASANGSATTEGCFFNNITSCGFAGVCNIDNNLESVEVEVTKEWTFESLVDIDQDVNVEILCENFRETPDGGLVDDSFNVVLDENDPSYSVFPYPNFGSPVSRCRAVERVVDSAVESDQGCAGWMTFGPGDSGVSCVITNTIFFEGVPTLNRYGLAVMALLMLGLGVLGFRRFV